MSKQDTSNNELTESLLHGNQKAESEEEKRRAYFERVADSYSWKFVFLVNVFLACVSFSIVLPSLWPYLQRFDADENFLAAVLAIYSIGEFLGAIAWGYIYNASSMKFSLYTCIGTGLAGSILYSLGGYFIPGGKWLVFVGRFIQGLWTGGQQAIEQAYISECIEKQKNLSMIADLGSAAVLGFVLGPVVGLVGRFINFNIGSFYVDEYTSCGYFQAIFTIIMFLSTWIVFTEIPREYRVCLNAETSEEEEDEDLTNDDEDDTLSEDLARQVKDGPEAVDFNKVDAEQRKILAKQKPNMIGVIISLIIFLIHFNGFAVQETITTPISTDIMHKYTMTLDYPESFAYVLFACSGVLSVITFMILKRITGLIEDNNLVMISSIMGLIGYLILIDYSPRIIEPARFIVGFCIISVAFPFGRGVTLSMFSKLIGKHKAGAYMGYILAVGAISRIVGPFWSVQALVVSPALTFGISAFLFLINILCQWIWGKHLVPHWSHFIDMHEAQKEGKLTGKKESPIPPTPGSINPLSPIPGDLTAVMKPSKPRKPSKRETKV